MEPSRRCLSDIIVSGRLNAEATICKSADLHEDEAELSTVKARAEVSQLYCGRSMDSLGEPSPTDIPATGEPPSLQSVEHETWPSF